MALKTSCGSEEFIDNSLDLDDSDTDALYIALEEDDEAETPATPPDRPSVEDRIIPPKPDDSDTDALYIALEEDDEAETPATPPDRPSVEDRIIPPKPEPYDQVNQTTEKKASEVLPSNTSSPVRSSHPSPVPPFPTPLISEYPSPFLPPYVLPPLITSFYPPHPMFHPHMMPAPHPALLPYQPPVYQHLPLGPNWILDSDDKRKVRISPDGAARASPTDSGVSTSSNPSPTRSSPNSSPQTPKASPKQPSPQTPKTSGPQTPETCTRTPGGRTSYKPHQVQAMERIFSENRYPDYDLLEKMSADLGIPAKKIKVWFQNKRARSKSRIPDQPISSISSQQGYGFGHHGLPTPYPIQVPTSVMPFPMVLS